MKTNYIPVLASLAVFTALVLLPLSVEFTASFIAIAGFSALFLADYARTIKRVTARAKVSAMSAPLAFPCAA